MTTKPANCSVCSECRSGTRPSSGWWLVRVKTENRRQLGFHSHEPPTTRGQERPAPLKRVTSDPSRYATRTPRPRRDVYQRQRSQVSPSVGEVGHAPRRAEEARRGSRREE